MPFFILIPSLAFLKLVECDLAEAPSKDVSVFACLMSCNLVETSSEDASILSCFLLSKGSESSYNSSVFPYFTLLPLLNASFEGAGVAVSTSVSESATIVSSVEHDDETSTATARRAC